MIPFLSLEKTRRTRITDIVDDHTPDHETFDAVLTVLEEFGPEEDEIAEVLVGMEDRVEITPGLWGKIQPEMQKKPKRILNWKNAKRRRPRRRP